jgi:hypothetical protein
MESIMVAAPRQYDDEFRSRLQSLGTVQDAAEGGLVFDDGTSRVYVTRNDFARDELEPEELERLQSMIATPVFYAVDFSDIRLVRKVMEAIADDPDLVVDNDHGVLMPGSEFVELLRRRPDWDWRSSAP